jgi:hypothetical protein
MRRTTDSFYRTLANGRANLKQIDRPKQYGASTAFVKAQSVLPSDFAVEIGGQPTFENLPRDLPSAGRRKTKAARNVGDGDASR